MKISIIIPWRVPKQRDRKEIAEWCFNRYRLLWPDAEIILADDEGENFSRGKSINKGVLQSTGDYIIITDADYLIPHEMAKELVNDKPWTVAVKNNNYFYIEEGYTNYILRNKDANVQVESLNLAGKLQSCPFFIYGGVLAMPKENFLKVKFDPNYSMYGYEDNSFYHCMKAFFGKEYRTNYKMYHLHHRRDADSPYMLGCRKNKLYYDKVYVPMLYKNSDIISYVNNYNKEHYGD